MPRVYVRVNIDEQAVVARVKAANRKALIATTQQALKDTNAYVPKDQRTLEDSSLVHSEIEKGILRWVSPYARYLYYGKVMHGNPIHRTYGPDNIKFTSALARSEWSKHSAKVHKAEWKKVYQSELRRRLKDG